MQIEIGKLFNGKIAYEQLMDIELPIHIAFRLSRLTNIFNETLEKIEKHRLELVKKYGEEKDGQVVVLEKNMDSFKADIFKLMNEKITLDFEKISIKNLENKSIKPSILSALEFLFDK